MVGITLDLREAQRRLTKAHQLAFDASVLLPKEWLDAQFLAAQPVPQRAGAYVS